MKAKYVDIGTQRFSHGKYYYITERQPIDVMKRSKGFVKRVNVFRYYIEMCKASLKEAAS